jgi:hypothetical protein
MKQYSYAKLTAAVLLGAGLLTVRMYAQDCDDRITSGGWITITNEAGLVSTANFGVHGGLDPSDPTQLSGNLNYVHKEVGLHVVAKDVIPSRAAATSSCMRRIRPARRSPSAKCWWVQGATVSRSA